MLAFLVLLCASSVAWSASMTLAWDPSSGASGYRLYYGTVSGTYPNSVNAGASTTATVTGLTSAQRYYFVVTAYNGSGAESAYSAEVSGVAPSAPVASFVADRTSGLPPLTVNFNSGGSTGSITSYAWTFGDGGTSTAANPSHTYALSGTYTVALTVTGPGGSNTQTRTGYISIAAAPPVAAFTADVTAVQAPGTVAFNSGGSTGTIASYAWTFGDGTTSTAANPSHAYTTPGVYTVALTVSGSSGSNTMTRAGYISVSRAPVRVGPGAPPELALLLSLVDTRAGAGTASNLNGILEPGESVIVTPIWHNESASVMAPTGTLSSFTGPAGAKYSINDRIATYGAIAPGSAGSCTATGNCYRVTVSNPAKRPALHWDATLHESLSTHDVRETTVHIGRSFSDVPDSDASYVSIETVFHNNVMTPFGDGTFRPAASSTRTQAMIATARALAAPAGGPDVIPASGQVAGASYSCARGGRSLYADVGADEEGCAQVHFLAAYGVDVNFGCTDASHACSALDASRAMMAVLIAGSAAGGDSNVPASGTFSQSGEPRSYNCAGGGGSHYPDVSVTSAYCRHVNYLWATGSLDASSDAFRPSSPVTRAQMADLITKGLGLTLD
ncbi:MAG: PKD domain-containing protein [Burkholderiales bacterium]